MTFKQHPTAAQASDLEPITPDMQKGLEIAAYICGMYGEGKIWKEVILSKGEQRRAMFWMRQANQPQTTPRDDPAKT